MHARSVASAVSDWKQAAENAVSASRRMVDDARLGAWEAPRIKGLIEKEMRESARHFDEEGHDIEIDSRVRRISLARCLMDVVDRMRAAAIKSNNSTLVMGVNAIQSKMSWLMDDSYFMKGEEDIYGEFLDLQPDLVACGKLVGVAVPGLREMTERHRIDTASTIGDYLVELKNAARERAAQ